jgi:hypothetical protein
MKFLKFDHSPCGFMVWTPWMTVLFDRGPLLVGGKDEFGVRIYRRGWGPIFFFGNRDPERLGESRKCAWFHFTTLHPGYRKEWKFFAGQRNFFEKKMGAIASGKEKHPVMMTVNERHLATLEVAHKLKFSKSFVAAMSAPFVLRALENGGYARDPLSGDELQLQPTEMKRLAGVTRENFRTFEEVWADNARIADRNKWLGERLE